MGAAQILTTLDDEVQTFDCEIEHIEHASRDGLRSIVVHITDEELINRTGGIVQGMSGSPIIQDGKLVGAVTHVLVNDPTRGYGIFIENMLEAAG
jgi:stage IV sporulation protein B